MKAKPVITVLGLALSVALVILAAWQIPSAEAKAVIIGVVCGVAAGIPTCVLILVALANRERRAIERTQRHRPGSGIGSASLPPRGLAKRGTPQVVQDQPPIYIIQQPNVIKDDRLRYLERK